jgi:mRNA interferase YafQ
MKYTVKLTSKFKKDYKLMMRRGRDIALLDGIIAKLATGETLEPANRNHELSGDYSGHSECHIEPDWLLIYRVYDNILVLSLTRTGSHSDLFKHG